MTADPPAPWTDTCGDTDPTPELARNQQTARDNRDPWHGDRHVDTVKPQRRYL